MNCRNQGFNNLEATNSVIARDFRAIVDTALSQFLCLQPIAPETTLAEPNAERLEQSVLQLVIHSSMLYGLFEGFHRAGQFRGQLEVTDSLD